MKAFFSASSVSSSLEPWRASEFPFCFPSDFRASEWIDCLVLEFRDSANSLKSLFFFFSKFLSRIAIGFCESQLHFCGNAVLVEEIAL